MTSAFCQHCGRLAADPKCCRALVLEEPAFDREGSWVDPEEARYCTDCGERRSASEIHSDQPHGCPPAPIRFYGVRSVYGEFSNFAHSPIRIEGRRYPSVEHYFQSQKFPDSPHAETIRRAKTAASAARFGRSRRHRLRKDWEDVKREVMLRGLRAKFSQNPELGRLLLETGEAPLIEHTPRDRYWGDGGDGSGKNWLGRLLMRVRDEMRAKAARS